MESLCRFLFDYFIEDYNSSVGIILNRDTEGLAGLRSLSVGLQYAYELQINENLGFRPGVQIAFFNRDINFDKLTFGDQFDPATGILERVELRSAVQTALPRLSTTMRTLL